MLKHASLCLALVLLSRTTTEELRQRVDIDVVNGEGQIDFSEGLEFNVESTVIDAHG